MSATTSQITGVTIVYPTVCSGPDQREIEHQSSTSPVFVWGIHHWLANPPPSKGQWHKIYFHLMTPSCWMDYMLHVKYLCDAKCILWNIRYMYAFSAISKHWYDTRIWTLFSWKTMTHLVLTLRWRHNGLDSVTNHQPHDCLLNRSFGHRSKKTSKLRVTGLCVGNSPVTGEFPAQMANNAENVSIWWRHHQSEHVGSCWRGDTRRQGINSHGIDLIVLDYSGLST